jgi:hypothetical protein
LSSSYVLDFDSTACNVQGEADTLPKYVNCDIWTVLLARFGSSLMLNIV